jgi:hypothetical protein
MTMADTQFRHSGKFSLRRKAKENLSGIPFGKYWQKTNEVPDKIASPCLTAGRSNFSGMTGFL